MRTKAVVAGLVLATLGGVLSACGGPTTTAPRSVSSPAGATATAPATAPTTTQPPAGSAPSGAVLSRVELAAKAGAICSAATAQGRKLVVPATLTTDPRAAASYFDKTLPPLDAETRALQALRPAPAVAAQWEALIGAQVALDRLAQGYRQSAHAGRQTSLPEIRQLVTVGQTIADAAKRLGARCT